MMMSLIPLLSAGSRYNGLCENKFTAEKSGYTSYNEGMNYPAWLTDCCYSNLTARETCESYQELFPELSLNCDDESKENPANLFSCIESKDLCNDYGCVQSCNNDQICQKDRGEASWCGDCN